MIRENFVFLSFRKLYGYLHVERRNVFFESVAVAKLLYMWTGSDTFKKSTLYILIFKPYVFKNDKNFNLKKKNGQKF